MNKTKLYIDVCCLCRPFDDQRYLRIKLETNALFLILEKIKQSYYQFLYSKVHLLEINAIDNRVEKNELLTLLEKIGVQINPESTVKIKERAEYLCKKGLGIADAAHLSFAESSAHYVISCDDLYLKKSNKYSTIPLLNPIEFCIKEDLK
jgi:predicted nucleic acid-binding protein